MAAMGDDAKRCVVWFGRPAEQERQQLANAGWITRVAEADGQGGVGRRNGDIVVALADLRDTSAQSVQAMERLMAEHPRLPWLAVVSPDMPTLESPFERILQASMDFFTDPLDVERLLDALRRLSGELRLQSQHDAMGITGNSEATCAVIASVRKYAPVELPVLITGETGTGKEVAARALHALSVRADRPFAAINCGALPPNLVHSELFGHERGAFTGANARRIGHFETAAGGTVFLDEIGDLPLDAQTNLLRFLQEGTLERVGSSQLIKLDVRVLAATHVDLEKAVEQGRFREDLYYRLNVLRLVTAPLRDRHGDLSMLASHFAHFYSLETGRRPRSFSDHALAAMGRHDWPGNVRELANR